MNDGFYDPIVAEVRKNREELLAEFDGDIIELHKHLAEQRAKWEALGFRYETQEERKTRLMWREQQEEELMRKIAKV